MVRFVKLLFPYLQLAFVGWVVWTANVPQWQTAASILLLAWVAIGIAVARSALAVVAYGLRTLSADDLVDLKNRVPITKPRHRR